MIASTSLDLATIRADFPILSRQVHGHPLTYLDNAATTQKPRSVLAALNSYYTQTNANVHRGVYLLSEEATAQYEGARAEVAQFINASSTEQIVFTRNATDAVNLVALSWGRSNLRPGDLIVCTEMEHHSNLVPWQMLAAATGARLEFVPIDDDGRLRLDVLHQLLAQEPRLLAVTAISNALGTVNPIGQIVEWAHAAGALVLIDAAQLVGHQQADVVALEADWLAFSGHKMYGPTGIGVLYGRQELLEQMPPVIGGGDMIRRVSLHSSTWNDLPWKFEAGTPPIAEAIGLGAAIAYIREIGLSAIQAHETALITTLRDRLAAVPTVSIYGPAGSGEHGAAVSFRVGEVHPHDVASVLDASGVAIRAGHHCAQPLMERLRVPATCRASVALYSGGDDIERLIQGLESVVQFFGRPRR